MSGLATRIFAGKAKNLKETQTISILWITAIKVAEPGVLGIESNQI